ESVHEYAEARCAPPLESRFRKTCRTARRRQGISALLVAVLHLPGGVPERGTGPDPGACLQVRARRRVARRWRLARMLLRRMPATVAQEGPRPIGRGRAVCAQRRAPAEVSRAYSPDDQEGAPRLSGVPPESGNLLRPGRARATGGLFLPG